MTIEQDFETVRENLALGVAAHLGEAALSRIKAEWRYLLEALANVNNRYSEAEVALEGCKRANEVLAVQHDALKAALEEMKAVAAGTKATLDITEANAMFDHIEGIARRALKDLGEK